MEKITRVLRERKLSTLLNRTTSPLSCFDRLLVKVLLHISGLLWRAQVHKDRECRLLDVIVLPVKKGLLAAQMRMRKSFMSALHSYPASDQYALGVVVYEWLSGD